MGLVDRLSEGGRDREGDDVGDGSADEEEEEEEEEVTPRRVRGVFPGPNYTPPPPSLPSLQIKMQFSFERRRR